MWSLALLFSSCVAFLASCSGKATRNSVFSLCSSLKLLWYWVIVAQCRISRLRVYPFFKIDQLLYIKTEVIWGLWWCEDLQSACCEISILPCQEMCLMTGARWDGEVWSLLNYPNITVRGYAWTLSKALSGFVVGTSALDMRYFPTCLFYLFLSLCVLFM